MTIREHRTTRRAVLVGTAMAVPASIVPDTLAAKPRSVQFATPFTTAMRALAQARATAAADPTDENVDAICDAEALALQADPQSFEELVQQIDLCRCAWQDRTIDEMPDWTARVRRLAAYV